MTVEEMLAAIEDVGTEVGNSDQRSFTADLCRRLLALEQTNGIGPNDSLPTLTPKR